MMVAVISHNFDSFGNLAPAFADDANELAELLQWQARLTVADAL